MRKPDSAPASANDAQPEPLDELKERIELFLLGLRRPVLTEPGKEVMDLAAGGYSFSTEYNKLLWHVWNDRANLVRQITGIRKESAGRMELRFRKFGKAPPGVLVVTDSRAAAEQLERRAARSQYAQRLRRHLAQLFPEWKAETVTSEPDLKNSFSGVYTRAVLARGQQAWAVIGAGEQEDPQTAEGILTYGLIWLDSLRRRDPANRDRVFEGLKIFLPPQRLSATLQRLSGLDTNLARYEVYETGDEVRRLDPADVGNLKIAFAPAGGAFSLRPPAHSPADRMIERIAELSSAIEIHTGPGNFRVLTLQGLAFAKQTPRGVVFGVGRAETLLEDNNFRQVKKLVGMIVRFRRAESEDRQHPFSRLQPEKWMQSILVRHIGTLGCDLTPDALYEQVPASSGAEGGLMDLLAVTSQGRLAVVEFKASEDIHMPLQALDYWLRVRWQQQRGELERQGYFPQRPLGAQAPLLLLVSPALQFHPACEIILRYFAPSIEALRLGLNENWRQHIQVVFRMGR